MRTARAMRSMVAILRTNNPYMEIVIRGFAGGDARSQGLTRQYQKLAREMSTANSPVVISMPSPGWQWDPNERTPIRSMAVIPTHAGTPRSPAISLRL